MNFFKVGGKWLTPAQMREWRAEQKLKSIVMCDWCITKGIRHLKDCPTLNANFDPENTPKLTFEERDKLMKQKHGSNNPKK